MSEFACRRAPLAAAFLASTLLFNALPAGAQPCEGGFPQGAPLDFIAPQRGVIGTFDFNRDGKQDLLFSTQGGASVALNVGRGFFGPTTDALLYASSVAVGDLDSDGVLDLVAVAPGITSGTSFIGTYKGFVTYGGSGVYFQNVTSIVGPPGSSSPVLGDFDGDGKLDLAILVSGFSVWVYPGDGGGGFGTPRTMVVGNFSFPAYQMWAADVNGDGRADLLIQVTTLKGTLLRTLLGGADGSFTEVSNGPQGGGFETSFDLAFGDVDGDGRLDVVVTNRAWLTNYGSVDTYLQRPGGFLHVTRSASPLLRPVLADFDGDGPTPATNLTAADFDGDGHADLVVSGFQDRSPLLYRNTCRGIERTLVVPVLLSLPGAGGTFWESDLTITNSSAKHAFADLTYTATAGGGSGTVTAKVPAGTQLYARSAFDLLAFLGLPLPAAAARSGTLRAAFYDLASPHAVGISVRTSSGGAGVAYPGIEPPAPGGQTVADLREDSRDRSNLGLMHAGTASDGPITLRVALTSTDPGSPKKFEDVFLDLQPGEFRQLNRVLATTGLGAASAFATVSLWSQGSVPFVAWGVVNDDTGTSDGSFQLGQLPSAAPWSLPSVVENLAYETELTLTNTGGACTVTLVYHFPNLAPRLVTPAGVVATVSLPELRTYHFEGIVDELRRSDPAGVGPRGPTYVGTLEVGGCPGVIASSRVLGTARRYGVAPPGILRPTPNPGYVPSLHSAWIPDLRQDGETRSNLVLVNLAWHAVPYLVELFDASGHPVASRRVETTATGWLQINSILADWAPGTTRGWARVSEVEPQTAFSFAAYAILNDGAAPGLGTGDGSIVWMETEP